MCLSGKESLLGAAVLSLGLLTLTLPDEISVEPAFTLCNGRLAAYPLLVLLIHLSIIQSRSHITLLASKTSPITHLTVIAIGRKLANHRVYVTESISESGLKYLL